MISIPDALKNIDNRISQMSPDEKRDKNIDVCFLYPSDVIDWGFSPSELKVYLGFMKLGTYEASVKDVSSLTKLSRVTVSKCLESFRNMELLPPEEGRPSRVYLITDGEDYKIGISENPHLRLSELQCGNKFQLKVCFQSKEISNARQIERDLHKNYKTCHIRGEWFSLKESDISDVINFIEGNGS